MTKPFVDYYEVLQLSPNATPDTIERVYRLLAKRYHPDNPLTGDGTVFAGILAAHEVLSNAERRAQYDVTYDDNRSQQWKIFDQQSASDGREEDQRIFHGVLSLLYVARRRDPRNGGMGAIQLERLLGVPEQHLEFPLWYLKQHGWVEIMDTGQIAITVQGIDKLGSRELSLPANRLLGPSSEVGPDITVAEPPRLAASDTKDTQ
jgi:curved DNA-binding protein